MIKLIEKVALPLFSFIAIIAFIAIVVMAIKHCEDSIILTAFKVFQCAATGFMFSLLIAAVWMIFNNKPPISGQAKVKQKRLR